MSDHQQKLPQQQIPIKDQKQKNKQSQKIEQKLKTVQQIKQQLLQVGFEVQLIDQALKMYQNKEEAITYIITRLDDLDPKIDVQKKQKKQQMVQENQQDFEDVNQEYKMVFLVRMDLKMGLGKIAAQVGHATLKAYKQMQYRADHNQLDQVSFFQWLQSGQRKIVLKVPDENQLLSIINKAKNMNLNTCYIRDAGLTQIAAGSLTVAAIGPAIVSDIDSITKHLKLL